MKTKNEVHLKKTVLLIIIFFLMYIYNPQNIHAETKDPIGDAKNGIVEIFSGFSDREGIFWRMKSGSGFLISNAEGTTYIVTNYSIIQNSSEEKTAYCEANGIDIENFGMTDSIRVVVKGDVTIDASVLTESKEMNFCILSTENAVNEKTELKLGDAQSLVTGDSIYALGFPKDIESLEFQTSDVEIFQGNIQDKESNQAGIRYLQHSAIISAGNSGGPILDAEGYVVGINCSEYSNPASGRYYSLPINELTEVLDNFSINYGSKKKDVLKQDLNALKQECIQLNESGRYKKDSLTALQTALSEAEKLSETENPALSEMEEIYRQLMQAKDALIPKMEKIQIAIYVFAGLIVLAILLLIRILFLNRQDKKKEILAEQNKDLPKQKNEPLKNGERQVSKEKKEEFCRNTIWLPDDNEEKTVGLSSYRKEHSAIQEEQQKFLQKTSELEILRKSSGQIIKINKPEYLIGKNPTQADLFISDNKAVSRKHASIVWKNNEYYVCDLGSVNGSYVKEKRIPEGILVKLSDGDTLRIADEEFTIRILDV